MSIKKFSVGDRVSVILNNKIQVGVIHSIYPELNKVIVKVDDWAVKVTMEEIAPVDDVKEDKIEADEPRKKTPLERSSVILTPDQFRDIVNNTIADLHDAETNPLMLISFSIFGGLLHKAIFELGDDD